MPHLKNIWTGQGWQHHWWPEALGGVPHPAADAATNTERVTA
jgi:hypothetical protein